MMIANQIAGKTGTFRKCAPPHNKAAMIRELSWYLESGRFGGLAEELEGSLRRYAEARKAGLDAEALSPMREEARGLFEGHCVRAGLRPEVAAYINIDAEFFSGDALDEPAMNGFIKNIIKGHCYQKVLWTYMGTTGLLTAISKGEMAQAGLKYEDYLPLEYREGLPARKPLEGRAGRSTELIYQYGDGTASSEYLPGKAKVRFDRLGDSSGVDWKAGYNPNGSVKKSGWHGDYDRAGVWARVDESAAGGAPAGGEAAAAIELVRDVGGAMLYDPGMLLLSMPLLLYVSEGGEALW